MANSQVPDRNGPPQVSQSGAEASLEASADANGRAFSDQAIHLMRTAQLNGLTHARMADQKASILLGATFLVFSLSISRALTGQLPIALTVLASFSFASSLCAVMAVLPSVTRPKGPEMNTNLLFFGHFAWMDEAEWTDELLDALETDESVFRTMAHDMYQNGLVLQAKKFRYLSVAYRIFIAGLATTLVVFAAEMMWGV